VLDVHLNAITRILHRRTASLQTPDYIITKTFCIQGPSATQVKEVLCRSMFCICIFSITGEFESHRNPFAQQKSSANPRPALYCPDNARQGHPPNGNNLRSRKLRRRQLKNYKINSNAFAHIAQVPAPLEPHLHPRCFVFHYLPRIPIPAVLSLSRNALLTMY